MGHFRCVVFSGLYNVIYRYQAFLQVIYMYFRYIKYLIILCGYVIVCISNSMCNRTIEIQRKRDRDLVSFFNLSSVSNNPTWLSLNTSQQLTQHEPRSSPVVYLPASPLRYSIRHTCPYQQLQLFCNGPDNSVPNYDVLDLVRPVHLLGLVAGPLQRQPPLHHHITIVHDEPGE